MKQSVHTFQISLGWELIARLSELDRFDATWSSIEKREGATLRQLRTVETIRSVGASTRIEGSALSDDEVEVLLQNIEISKLDDRDSQEVLGYFETLDLILESHGDIDVSEGSIKNLHNSLLAHCERDSWHRGNYKMHSNVVEATLSDGTKQVVFKTAEPGYPTQEAMQSLLKWYDEDDAVHPLVKCALFAYDLVSIHPFQDGNGRLSRLLSTLLILKYGYSWIQYVSFEHEIESRKKEYYRELRSCQADRPGEDISSWVRFFLSALQNIQSQLSVKLNTHGIESQLSPREKSVLVFVGDHPGCRSGDVAEKLSIPSPTVKKMLTRLVDKDLISRHGRGPGTNYSLK